MSRGPRRNHTPVFKSKVALAAITGDRTVAELSQQYIRRIRPGFGLSPKFESPLIGKKVKIDIKTGTATS